MILSTCVKPPQAVLSPPSPKHSYPTTSPLNLQPSLQHTLHLFHTDIVIPSGASVSHTTSIVMPDVIGHLLGLRGNLVLKSTSVRDMVRGESLAPGFNSFFRYIFCERCASSWSFRSSAWGLTEKIYRPGLGVPCCSGVKDSGSSLRRTDGGAA